MAKRIVPLLCLFLSLIFGTLLALEKRKNGEIRAAAESTRTSLAALADQAERDRLELEKLRQQIGIYRSESESFSKKLASGAGVESQAASESASPLATQAAGDGGEKTPQFLKGLAKMFSDPKMKKAMLAQQAVGIRMMYGEFFKEHSLDPDVAQSVSDILGERQMEMSAAGMSAINGEKPGTDAGVSPEEIKQRYDDLLKATMGDESYAAFKNYEESIGERFMLQQFDAQFATANAPLAADQRATLLSIMSEERKNAPASALRNAAQNPQAQMEALSDPAAIDSFVADQEALNQRVLTRARDSLSADQVAALERAQSQMLEMMRAQMTMAREMFGK